MKETLYRKINIKERLPNLGKRILFLDEGYKGKFMAEYTPNEPIEIKKGKFIEIKDCHLVTNYLLNNYTHWLEEIIFDPFSREL